MVNLGFVTGTEDGVYVKGPCLVYGLLVDCDSSGFKLTFYDGVDAVESREVHALKVLADYTQSIRFYEPLRFDSGVYLLLSAHILEVTLCYIPLESERLPIHDELNPQREYS